MNFDLSAFDIEKIVRKDQIILNTNALTQIEDCCRTAQTENMFIGITGESGYGKSTAFDYYKNNNPNVFHVTVEKSMRSADLYLSIADQIGVKGINSEKPHLNRLIKTVAYALNTNSDENLLILDEAGKFTPHKLLFLHELRDATLRSTGIIVAGPQYFQQKIETWVIEQREGIPELHRRIQGWTKIEKPTKEEMIMLCKESGIRAADYIKALIGESTNLGDLSNKILQARLFVLRQVQGGGGNSEPPATD